MASPVHGEIMIAGGDDDRRGPLKILSLTSLFPSHLNPVRGVFIKERVRHVAKHHQLQVVAPVPYFPPVRLYQRWHQYARIRSRERIAGLDVHHPRYLITPRIGMVFYGLLYFLSLYPFLKRLSREFAFDLIDAHYLYPDGFAAVLLARALRRPVVLSARGTDVNLFMKLPLIRIWILHALRHCDRIIAVSGALREAMMQAGIDGKKIDVIPNGVDADSFPAIPKDQAREELGLPREGVLLLSVGSLRRSKNFEHLLQALVDIRSSAGDRDVRLVIVGYGHHRGRLEKEIDRLHLGPYVILAGRVPHSHMYKWYHACDLFCLASSSEGWPNVIFEALACGLPVVATPVGGVPEILVSPNYGLLLEDCQTSRLSSRLRDGILEALGKDWDREKMMAYARQHTWDAVANRVQASFHRALDGRQGHP
jgi:teichuronic acid biosynthesis glycosyltransferase TuaC